MASTSLTGNSIFGEPFSELVDLLSRRSPVGVAGITVEHQTIGFHGILELLACEPDGLVVIVRTDNLDIYAFAHSVLLRVTKCYRRSIIPQSKRIVDRRGEKI
jgi:hypothetical protein